MKTLVSGGEQILEPVMSAFLSETNRFGITADRFRPCWGMTETTTGIAFGSYDHPDAVVTIDDRRLVSIGEPSPGATFRVVDQDGTVLPEGRVGALQVRSARITTGYVGDSRPPVDSEGWFDTGDLAHLADGRLTVTGRGKDIIILNGHNHDCHTIEEVAGEVTGVRSGLVGAVGVPDTDRGSEVLGLAVVASDEPAAEPAAMAARVRRAVSERLGLTAPIVAVVTEAEFPRTGSGKIQRGVIRERLASREWPDVAAVPPAGSAAPAADRHDLRSLALAACRRVLNDEPAPDRPLYEQGVDSIRLPRLAEELSRELNRTVTTTMLLRHGDVDTLVSAMTGTATRPATARPGDGRTPSGDRRIAVIGMAGRFPGADSVERFWSELCAGHSGLRRFTSEQLAAAGVPAREYRDSRYVPVTGVLGENGPEAIGEFDADLFGISATEAGYTDPQQRLFLEICHQTLESAGYAGVADDSRIGLFAGCGMNLYAGRSYLLSNLLDAVRDPLAAMQTAMGNQPDFLATRVSHRLGLTGPAVTVQTACSTSLVAVHQAIGALLGGEADVALAGAASVHVPAVTGYLQVDGTMMSPTGQCRSFDAAAAGTVGGNGVACVVLKRLDAALADGDTVLGVILGSAVTNDGGDKVGFTAPSVSGQVATITAALDAAGVAADSIGYVEAHGTGTRLGDPLEVRALAEAFAARTRSREHRCALGSVKANIGHLDACAGMAGLIKAILVLRHGRIPPQINFDAWNPAIDPGPFRIHTRMTDWPAGELPRRAAVQALGVGGTNAHVVLEEPPIRTRRTSPDGEPTGGVVLSGHTPQALTELTERFTATLRGAQPPNPVDVFTTTALGRRHRAHRLVAFGDTAEELAEALSSGAVIGGRTQRPGRLGFVFTGQGRLRSGFARALYDTSATCREVIDRCVAAVAAELPGTGLADALLDDSGVILDSTALAQPALFAAQSGLVAHWARLGVRPDYLAGHSVGEYAAWCAAGSLTVEDGARLTAIRGDLMQRFSPAGAMLAVRADRRTVAAVRAVIDGLDVAVVNADNEHVLAGTVIAIDEAAALLERRDISTARLPVTRAFHSRLLDGMLPDFSEWLTRVRFGATRLPVISGDGTVRTAGFHLTPEYLAAQARDPVRWDRVITRLREADCGHVLELGPGAVLTGIGRRAEPGLCWLAGTTEPRGNLAAAARLHCDGHRIDWRFPAAAGNRVPLPTHPFRRTRHWIDP